MASVLAPPSVTSHGNPSSVCETAELQRKAVTAMARMIWVDVLRQGTEIRFEAQARLTSARHHATFREAGCPSRRSSRGFHTASRIPEIDARRRRMADAAAGAAGPSLDVRALLAQSAASGGRPSIQVDKEDDLTYDLGHLCASDPSPLDEAALKVDASAYLLRIARDNAQLLTNRLYGILATQPNKSAIKLPEPTTALPREKPLPKPKPLTRWEKFAAEKGIVKKKRSKMVWDETAQRWAPRFGYGKANKQDDPMASWLIPAKPGDDGSVDPFEEQATRKRDARSKQKRQEERNRLEAAHAAGLTGRRKGAAATGNSLGGSLIAGDLSSRADKAEYLKGAMRASQVSTASLGRFDRQLDKEPAKNRGVRKQYGSATVAADVQADVKRAASVAGKIFPEDSARTKVRARAVDAGKASKVARLEEESANRKAKLSKVAKSGAARPGKKARPAPGGGGVGKGKATFKVKSKAAAMQGKKKK
jgi:regulator of ribosome biosynthesis